MRIVIVVMIVVENEIVKILAKRVPFYVSWPLACDKKQMTPSRQSFGLEYSGLESATCGSRPVR